MQISGVRAILVLGAFGLSGCQPTIPDSGAGVGFADYNAYEAQRLDRERILQRGGAAAQTPVTPIVPSRPVISGDELRSAGLPVGGGVPQAAIPGAASVADYGRTSNAAPPGTGAPIEPNNRSISDEQDFNAVSGRETIESDAERLARQRAAYQVIQPTPVPQRSGANGPNIVAYALSTSNPVGQQVYQRSRSGGDSRFLRACAAYGSSDRAQEDFLKNGGPQKDSKGIDPDGDGFACYWDPTPFRRASN